MSVAEMAAGKKDIWGIFGGSAADVMDDGDAAAHVDRKWRERGKLS